MRTVVFLVLLCGCSESEVESTIKEPTRKGIVNLQVGYCAFLIHSPDDPQLKEIRASHIPVLKERCSSQIAYAAQSILREPAEDPDHIRIGRRLIACDMIRTAHSYANRADPRWQEGERILAGCKVAAQKDGIDFDKYPKFR